MFRKKKSRIMQKKQVWSVEKFWKEEIKSMMPRNNI